MSRTNDPELFAALVPACRYCGDEVQFPAIKAAQAKKNRFAEDKIKKLGAKVLEIATFHLDEEKVVELKEELAELRKIEEMKAENELTTPNQFVK